MSILRPQCSHCIYWVSEDTGDVSKSGHCHRNPPSVYINPQTGHVIQKFPTTEHRHWCGEWNDDESVIQGMMSRTTGKAAAVAD